MSLNIMRFFLEAAVVLGVTVFGFYMMRKTTEQSEFEHGRREDVVDERDASPAGRNGSGRSQSSDSSFRGGSHRPECCVCMERPLNVCFEPCRHVAVCGTCAARLAACPICNTHIKAKRKVFIA